jgi:hypothetical protein
MEVQLKLAAETDELRIVWAEVYAPNIPDSDGEFMDAKGIMQMAYKFMQDLNLRMIDTQHTNNLVEGACVVESFIARKGDPDFIEGSWVVGVHVPDDATWEKIKKGEINGFSMEAMVHKVPTELEMEIPPVIAGRTTKAENYTDDHEHQFFVSYDEDGNFLGGVTDTVDGHYHAIKRGTLTEVSKEHQHKFSYVELMKAPG